MNKRLFYLLLITGFFFRLLFVYMAPQPDIFDQKEYHQFARGILTLNSYDLGVSSYRTYGYPLILAAIYHVAGIENRWAWIIFQALLDTGSALLVLGLAQKIFRKVQPALVAYVMYLFNPFTSAYVGTRLTEVLTTFTIALIFFFFIIFLSKRNIFILFTLAFILGYLPFIRPGFFLFSIITFLYLIYLAGRFMLRVFSVSLKILFIAISILLFMQPVAYNSARNLAYFGQLSPLTVHNNFIKDFYLSLIINNQDSGLVTKEFNWVYQEFFKPDNKEERQAMADKYWSLAIANIKHSPPTFVLSRIRGIFSVWEKHSVFPYNDPIFYRYLIHVYWGNVILLFLAFSGLYLWLREVSKNKKSLDFRWFAALVIFLIIYISIIHTGVMASGRFSIPAYPIIFLFAGFGIWKIFFKIKYAILPVKLWPK